MRMFMARGLAYICNLLTECPSQTCTVSNANTTLLLALLMGLVDMDIQGEILAKVEQMDLKTKIAFVEIREMDKRAAVIAGFPFPVPGVNLWRHNDEVVESN